MNRKGLILLQVLILSVLLGLIASQILKLIFQPALAAANAAASASNGAQAQAAVNKVNATWTAAGKTCSSDAVLGVSCGGSPGSCRCSCSVAGLPPVTATGPAAGPCTLNVKVTSP